MLSMTGFGTAERSSEHLHVRVEVKAVNNRHLKVAIRSPHGYSALEHDLEKLVRERVARGTINVFVSVHRKDGPCGYVVDEAVFHYYIEQWQRLAGEMRTSGAGATGEANPALLLTLPGVVREDDEGVVTEHDWPLIQETVDAALASFNQFRGREGDSMHETLKSLCHDVGVGVGQIAERSPQAVAQYRERLRDRINELLKEVGAAVTDADLVREICLFADRCDVTEEITRLRSHLTQFLASMELEASPGRKLDFLCQELLREVNTIGSKANDAAMAQCVVGLKATIEKIRELVQNIE